VDAALEMHKAIWAWKNFDGVNWVDLKEIEERFNTAIEEYKK